MRGLVDLHIHGAFGVDVLVAGGAEMDRLAAGLWERGVSTFLPTLVPLPLGELPAVVERLAFWMRGRRPGDGRGAFPAGLHFEGPFVSPARCGALHPACLLDASDLALVARFLEAAAAAPGRPMITLAPEIRGGLELVRRLADLGYLVSIGHTDAGFATLDAAFAAGARHMTHFGNAMRPFHHRDVGPLGWGLLHDEITLDVIADLHHLAPEMLRLVLKARPGRVALISDAVPPAGLPDGAYEVWGETLELRDGAVRNARSALAGSASLLDTCVERLTATGVPADVAREAASSVPARILSGG